jgi:SWI/SNF-related matrix-associated actin-dependent regulator of chromatin subfamily A-like protein 1
VSRILQDFDFPCVIADESHNLKEKTSQRTQLAMPILLKAKRLVLLSGTPALARPVELWSQVHPLAPDLFGSYTQFTKEYCNAKRGRFGWDVSGLSNADDLHSKLRQVMVRRLKSDVLKELPAKQRSMVPISKMIEEKNCRELMDDLKATRLSVAELAGNDARSADFEARRLLMMAYQQSGIAKAPAVAQYLLDWLEGSSTQKILVFAHHQEVLDVLEQAVAKKFRGVGHIRIDGSVDSKERAVRVKKFQTNATTRVALLSMTAAGVGLTLTAASSVLFAELHWTPGVLAQAEDRCHRIGQKNAVHILYCVCKDPSLSIDMSLWSMLTENRSFRKGN